MSLSPTLKQTIHLTYSICFSCTVTNKCYSIPIAFIRTGEKSADKLAEEILYVLKRYGITQDDLYKSVNDTTASAVFIGKLLVQDAGTCAMHVVDLIIKHSFGLVVRTRTYDDLDADGNKTYDKAGKKKKKTIVIDSFPECMSVRKYVWEAISYLMSPRKRFAEYEKVMSEKVRPTTRLALPNATR